MEDRYLYISKEILPDYYFKVIEARNLINTGAAKNISDAVKKVGISRSTYYKFKDYVFPPSESSYGSKAVIALMLAHQKGVLSDVLNMISSKNASVLTINQSIPIRAQASVMISLDTSEMPGSIDQLINDLNRIVGVTNVRILAFD